MQFRIHLLAGSWPGWSFSLADSPLQIRSWGSGQSSGAVLSVEGIQQQQDGTDANDTSKDERVTSLPEVDPLYQAVHSGKAVGQSIHLAVN